MASSKFQQEIYVCVCVCAHQNRENLNLHLNPNTFFASVSNLMINRMKLSLVYLQRLRKKSRFKKSTTRVMRVVLKHFRVIVLPCCAIVIECPVQSGNRRRKAQHNTSTRRVQFWLFQAKLNKLHARAR